MICYAKILYVMVCHDMLWYAIICYDMLWYKCKRQDTVHTGSPGIHQATMGGNSSPQLSISRGHNKIWNNKIWYNKIWNNTEQGCTTCCILASRMRENGERLRKWRGSGERMRKWRGNEEIYQKLSHFVAKCQIRLGQNITKYNNLSTLSNYLSNY